ncbi:unnamed protein product [Discosporangium mesarthrocarpum]
MFLWGKRGGVLFASICTIAMLCLVSCSVLLSPSLFGVNRRQRGCGAGPGRGYFSMRGVHAVMLPGCIYICAGGLVQGIHTPAADRVPGHVFQWSILCWAYLWWVVMRCVQAVRRGGGPSRVGRSPQEHIPLATSSPFTHVGRALLLGPGVARGLGWKEGRTGVL